MTLAIAQFPLPRHGRLEDSKTVAPFLMSVFVKKEAMAGSGWISTGAIVCGLAVALGAFAAHGLDKVFVQKYADKTRDVAGQTVPLATKFLNDFKTAAEYQMYHGLALIAVGLLIERRPSRAATAAGWAFVLGILLFSGSLYTLTITGVTKWGAVTPLGGVAFLIGWACLALAGLGQLRNSHKASES